MKLLLDKDGNVVVKDGKPVYVHEDGEEIPFDAPAAMAKIGELNNENKDRRHKLREAEEALSVFKDLDPEKAREALEKVEALGDGEILSAEKLDEIREKMKIAYQDRELELIKRFEDGKLAQEQIIKDKDRTIRKLTIDQQFAVSPVIKQKTVLPGDIAAKYFGDNFRVELDGDRVNVVGYIGSEKIYSKEKPGEPAGFEEALKVMIDRYPNKDSILSESHGGAGSHNGTSRQGNMSVADRLKLSPAELLKQAHKESEHQAT